MALTDTLAAWKPAGTDALREADALVSHLASQGFMAQIIRQIHEIAGIAVVLAMEPGELPAAVLVAPGDLGSVRQAVWSFAEIGLAPHRRALVSQVSAPDVELLMSGPIAELEVALGRLGITPNLELAALSDHLDAALPVARESFGVRLDLDDADATCAEVDALVHALRPYGDGPADDGMLWPPGTVALLGLAAQEAILRALGGTAQLGRIELDGRFTPVRTLGDAGLMPAVLVGDRGFSVPKRVFKLWMSGDRSSVASISSMWGPLKASAAPKGQADLEVLRTALALAGQAAGLMLCNLDEGTPCVPSTLALVDGRVRMGYLGAPDSGAAEGMFADMLRGELAGAEAAAMALDGMLHGGDALWAFAADPSTGTVLRYVVPYVRDAEGLQFPRAPLMVPAYPGIDQAEADRIVLSTIQRMEEPVVRRLLASRGVESLAQPRPLEAQLRSRRELAGMGVSTAVARVGAATGQSFDTIATLLGEAKTRGELDEAWRILMLSPIRPSDAMRMAVGDDQLTERSLVALGMLVRDEPTYRAGLDEVLTFLGSIAVLGGQGPEALAVVHQLLAVDFTGDLGEAPQPPPRPTDGSEAFAIPAALFVVLATKGSASAADLRAMMAILGEAQPPLDRLASAVRERFAESLAHLQESPALVGVSLRSFGTLAPAGTPLRAALLELVTKCVAEVGGEGAIEQVEALLG
ncbi:MAG: hypothetical protein H6736_12735 [Alphaproteobacteria bacterium]|nr:hypothetical protein [Alphaproteobacteria bacterium]